MRSRIIIFSALALLQSSLAHATRTATTEEIEIFKAHYSELKAGDEFTFSLDGEVTFGSRAKYKTVPAFLKGMLNTFITEKSWCVKYTDPGSDCIQRKYKFLIRQARKDSVLDAIEEALLLDYLPAILLYQGRLYVDKSRKLVRTPRKYLRTDELPMPDLQPYLQRKRNFEKMRLNTGKSQYFDYEFLNDLKKNYRKRIDTLGRVDLVSYLYVKFSNDKVVVLKDALITALRRAQETEPVYLVWGKETIYLSESMKQKLPFCFLRDELKRTFNLEGENGMARSNPDMEDVLAAALVTGDLVPGAVSEMMKWKDFDPYKPNYSRVIGFVDNLARTWMLIQPQLILYYTIANIAISTRGVVKRYRRQQSETTEIIECVR